MEHNFTWKNDGRTKVMIGCGTRPEIIRLAAVIKRCREYFDCCVVYYNQNWDRNLSTVFWEDFELKNTFGEYGPDILVPVVGENLGVTCGNIMGRSYELLSELQPEGYLVLGDTNSCLSAILKNEVYTGTMVQGKRQKINYKIKKIRDVEESGWIKVPNMHEAIIPQKLFDTVQEVLKLDTCASKGQRAVNLFSGIVRCGGCGQNMVRRTVSKNGKKYVYLHCITNHNGLGCSSHLISESKLAEVVLAALQGKIQQISGLEQRLDEINEIPKNQRRLKSVEEHMKMLEQEEQKYQTLRRQLYEDMSNGIVSKDEYKEFSRSFNEKVENIRKAKTEMNRQLDSLNNLDVEHLPWIEDFKSYQNLTSLNRRVLVELVESITVYDKEHIHIQYRFDQEIRNVLEYCNSIPTTETEGSTV